MNTSFRFVSTLLIAGVAGCAETPATSPPATPEPIEAEVTVTPQTIPASEDDPQNVAGPTFYPVVVMAEVQKLCPLPGPNFEFDSAKVREEPSSHLDRLATCLQEGPLENASLELVGHADKRGPDDYNHELGERRAASVKDYLVEQGVEASRLETSSKGESMADPDNGWQDDRRVEIDVLERG